MNQRTHAAGSSVSRTSSRTSGVWRSSVFTRHLETIDDEHVHRASASLYLEAKLVFERRRNRRQLGRLTVGAADDASLLVAHVKRAIQSAGGVRRRRPEIEVESAAQAGVID